MPVIGGGNTPVGVRVAGGGASGGVVSKGTAGPVGVSTGTKGANAGVVGGATGVAGVRVQGVIGGDVIAGDGIEKSGLTISLDAATLASLLLADSAVQPGDLASVATTGAYADLSGLPTLGTAAAADITDFATASDGALAVTAVQPSRTITAGTGLTGGGTLAADRSIALSSASIASLALADTAVQPARTITAGTGLTGGGSLAADRTVSLSAASIASLALADGSAQKANNLSDLASASTARTNLGLGSIATQSAASVTITGGSVTGITDIAVADGGTGASTAAGARTNLGLVIGTDVQAQSPNLSAVAGLTSAADRLPYFTGSGTASLATFTAAGRALVDDADASAQRTTLGLGTAATMAGPSGAIVGTTDTQTLTNKTLTAPVISTIVNTGTLTLPTITDTLVGRATTDTLSNKTLSSPTLSGTVGGGFTMSGSPKFAGGVGGSEGGEFYISKPVSSTTLAADLVVDANGDYLRIFENGGSYRGVKIPITSGGNSVGTDLVGNNLTQTLTNKTIAAGSNTITGLANANIASGAAISVNKLAAVTASRLLVSDGSGFVSPASVTATEAGYLSGVTSGIQSQINGKVGTGTTITAGTGLTGGGDLSANRTLSADFANQATAEAGTDTTQVINAARLKNAMMNGTFLTQTGTGAANITFPQKLKARVNLSDFGSSDQTAFDAALTAASANGWMQLVVEKQYTLTTNTTVPRGVTIAFEKAGSFTAASGIILTFKEPIVAPAQRIFFGSLVVKGLRTALPEWWGAPRSSGSSDSAALQAAHDCMEASTDSAGIYMLTLSGDYYSDTRIDFRPSKDFPFYIEGSGTIFSSARIYAKASHGSGPAVWVRGQTAGGSDRIASWGMSNFAVVALSGTGATIGIKIGEAGKDLIGEAYNPIEDVMAEGFATCWQIGSCGYLQFNRCSGKASGVSGGIGFEVTVLASGDFCGDIAFHDCQFRAPNNSGIGFWIHNDYGSGTQLKGVSLDRCIWYGGAPFLKIGSSAASIMGDIFLGPGCQFDGVLATSSTMLWIDPYAGTIVENVQIKGVYFRGVGSASYAILIPNDSRAAYLRDVRIEGCWISDCPTNATYISGNDNLVYIGNGHAECADTVAIAQFKNNRGAVISGNTFKKTTSATAAYAIKLESDNDNITCIGNTAYGLSTTHCVYDLMASTKHKAVHSNVDENAKAFTVDEAGTLTVGKSVEVNGSDSNRTALLAGTTKGVKVYHDSTHSYIVGVDYTGIGSYQPLDIGGSVLTFSNYGTIYGGLYWGNFGFGTTSPSEKLHVAGNAYITGSVDFGSILKAGGGKVASYGGGYFLLWPQDGSSSALGFGPSGDPSNYHTANTHYFSNRAGSVVFGAWTSAALQVWGDVRGSTLTITSDRIENWATNATANIVINYNGYNGGATQFRDLYVADGKTVSFAKFEGSTQRFGLGTTSPGYTLDNNSADVTAAKFGASIPIYLMGDAAGIGFNAYYASGWKFGAGSSSHYGGVLVSEKATGDFVFYRTNSGNAGATATLTESVRIKGNGKVNISGLPTSSSGLATGDLWNDSGTLKVA